METTIILVTSSGGDWLKVAVKSILETAKDFKLWIIESESDMYTQAILREMQNDSRVKVFHTKKEGVVKAFNLGMKKAKGDVYLTHDDTLHFFHNWLQVMQELSKKEECGLITWKNGGGISGPDYIDGLSWAGTWGLYIPKRTIKLVGYFDENFGKGNGEDIDYSYRVKNAGLRMFVLDRELAHHHLTEHPNDKSMDLEVVKKRNAKYFREKMETAILINTKDRPTELALLLQSLRTQDYQDFDIYILDDFGGTPLTNYHFFNCMITRLKQENHKVFVKRTDFTLGVSRARQEIVDWALKGNYKYFARVDDDVILEPKYLSHLKYVLRMGYDLASGVTVAMQSPQAKRDPKFVKGIFNRVILDEEGNYIMNGDDCGIEYTKYVIFPAHHFRSCALYKTDIHKKANYYPTPLSMHGFREEQIFSYRLLMEGFTIGVHSGAINYHQMTPSGGERPTTNMTGFNQEQFEKFTKENKNKLRALFPNEPMPSKLELTKQTNLIMR